jgi:alpha-L-fucosidase
MVMCTRQHDGFALWDSQVSDFTSMKAAAHRDFVAEYADAARRAGLGVGFYYSLLDWRKPAYFAGPENDPEGWAEFTDYVHAQVRELCTNYGQVDILWYDGWWPYGAAEWRSEELDALARTLQPGILINDRSGTPGDFGTPEQHIPQGTGKSWETCMTMNEHWGYCPADTSWKSSRELVANLFQCATGGGNFLLNVGPDSGGAFPPESVERLHDIGRWLNANGEAIYGTPDTPSLRHLMFPDGTPWGSGWSPIMPYPATIRGENLYVYVKNWAGTELTVGNLGKPVKNVRFLDGGAPVEFRKDGGRVVLSGLPETAPDPLGTVLVLECEGTPAIVQRLSRSRISG